jgi:hypothetical protein
MEYFKRDLSYFAQSLMLIYCTSEATRLRRWSRRYARRRKGADSIPDEVTEFLHLPNPSSRHTSQGSTQTPTEMTTRNLPGSKEQPMRKADNITAICEPTV